MHIKINYVLISRIGVALAPLFPYYVLLKFNCFASSNKCIMLLLCRIPALKKSNKIFTEYNLDRFVCFIDGKKNGGGIANIDLNITEA